MKRLHVFFSFLVLCALMGNTSVAQSANSITAGGNAAFQGPPTSIAPGFSDYSHVDVHSTYTLQLVAMDNLDKAIAYAQKHNIDPRLGGVARTHTNGKLWYILAVGVYPTRAEAVVAKVELEARGVPTPWIRTLGSIEALSREANDLDM